MLCCAMLCYVVRCYAFLCYAVLCHAMLRFAMLFCLRTKNKQYANFYSATIKCYSYPLKVSINHNQNQQSHRAITNRKQTNRTRSSLRLQIWREISPGVKLARNNFDRSAEQTTFRTTDAGKLL